MSIISLQQIADQFSLELIILFGSRATGCYRKDSDTDIAVRSSYELRPQGLSFEDQLTIAVRLDALYKNVELCDLRKASPLLLGSIGAEGKLLYQNRESLFEEFKIFAWNQYQDYKPQLNLLRETTKKNINLI
jgi:predicted nucleotidyltransferase